MTDIFDRPASVSVGRAGDVRLWMFVVAVEKKLHDDDGPDQVIIVRANWLTPRKQECYWPPYKLSSKFNAALSSKDDPKEDWKLIQIKKRLYATDDLQTARAKAKQAEFCSDLVSEETDDPAPNAIRSSKRKKRKRVFPNSPIETASEFELSEYEPEINHSITPPSGSLYLGVQENNRKKSCKKLPTQDNQQKCIPTSTPPVVNESFLVQTEDYSGVQHNDEPSCSQWPSQRDHLSPPIGRSTYRHCIENSNTQITQHTGLEVLLRKIENLKETVDENYKLLHALFAEKQKDENDDSSTILPFTLPCDSLEVVYDVEDYLKDAEKRKKIVSILGSIGGVSAEKHLRRILCYLFTDDLARLYNWSGKGNKKAFKDTIFPTLVIDAVNATNVTLVQQRSINLKSA